MGARISSMLRKAGELAGGTTAGTGGAAGPGGTAGTAGFADAARTLSGDGEWELLKTLAAYDAAVALAAENIDPSVVAAYLYDLSKAFSRFYHDCPILQAGSPELVSARLALSKAVLRVLKDALWLINIPFLETM
jgi:arginyl-tRNA synthetase